MRFFVPSFLALPRNKLHSALVHEHTRDTFLPDPERRGIRSAWVRDVGGCASYAMEDFGRCLDTVRPQRREDRVAKGWKQPDSVQTRRVLSRSTRSTAHRIGKPSGHAQGDRLKSAARDRMEDERLNVRRWPSSYDDDGWGHRRRRGGL